MRKLYVSVLSVFIALSIWGAAQFSSPALAAEAQQNVLIDTEPLSNGGAALISYAVPLLQCTEDDSDASGDPDGDGVLNNADGCNCQHGQGDDSGCPVNVDPTITIPPPCTENPDPDSDGFVYYSDPSCGQSNDFCPSTSGSANGCADPDGDGVANEVEVQGIEVDVCPKRWGSLPNGCNFTPDPDECQIVQYSPESVNVRATPGGDIVGAFWNDFVLDVIDLDEFEGVVWYQVTGTDPYDNLAVNGWVSSEVTSTPTGDCKNDEPLTEEEIASIIETCPSDAGIETTTLTGQILELPIETQDVFLGNSGACTNYIDLVTDSSRRVLIDNTLLEGISTQCPEKLVGVTRQLGNLSALSDRAYTQAVSRLTVENVCSDEDGADVIDEDDDTVFYHITDCLDVTRARARQILAGVRELGLNLSPLAREDRCRAVLIVNLMGIVSTDQKALYNEFFTTCQKPSLEALDLLISAVIIGVDIPTALNNTNLCSDPNTAFSESRLSDNFILGGIPADITACGVNYAQIYRTHVLSLSEARQREVLRRLRLSQNICQALVTYANTGRLPVALIQQPEVVVEGTQTSPQEVTPTAEPTFISPTPITEPPTVCDYLKAVGLTLIGFNQCESRTANQPYGVIGGIDPATGNADVYVWSREGLINITNSPAVDETRPVLSPNGMMVAYLVTTDAGNHELRYQNVENGRSGTLNSVMDFPIQWFNDDYIFYVADDQGVPTIFITQLSNVASEPFKFMDNATYFNISVIDDTGNSYIAFKRPDSGIYWGVLGVEYEMLADTERCDRPIFDDETIKRLYYVCLGDSGESVIYEYNLDDNTRRPLHTTQTRIQNLVYSSGVLYYDDEANTYLANMSEQGVIGQNAIPFDTLLPGLGVAYFQPLF